MNDLERRIVNSAKVLVAVAAISISSSEKSAYVPLSVTSYNPDVSLVMDTPHDASFLTSNGTLLFHNEKKVPTELSYDEIEQFALYIDYLHDQIPEEKIPMSQQDLENWVKEIVPHFKEDGFTAVAEYPDSVKLVDFNTLNIGTDFVLDPLNVEGLTTCEIQKEYSADVKHTVYINSRFNNPASTIYQDPESITTETHELGHVAQGIRCKYGYILGENLETDAQIATVEVQANMALEGNRKLVPIEINFLETLAMNAAKYKALTDTRYMPRYKELVRRVYSKPSEQAKLAQIDNAVKDNEEGHIEYLDIYNYQTLKELLLADEYTQDTVTGLQFGNGTVIMDDSGYFIHHAPALVYEYIHDGK